MVCSKGMVIVMTIYSLTDLFKSYVTQKVLSDVSFKIDHNDKIGVVGVNGAGKTTLFRIMCGIEEPDSGQIFRDKNTSVSYMQQHSDYTSENSAKEELLDVFSSLIALEKRLDESTKFLDINHSEGNIKKHLALQEEFEAKGGLTYKSRIRATLMGLGFSDGESELPLSALSGGQRTRVLLAKILLSDSKLILLDEPTNHLDINSTLWLEDFLINYKGALVIISHDRFFLDRVCNKIFEVENTKLKEYKGNYTAFREQKELNRLTLERDYVEKQKDIKRIEGIIAKQKTFSQEHNYITIKSKQKQIDRIKSTLEKPEKDPDKIGFKFEACSRSGNDVLTLENISKAYGQKKLFSNINMEIKLGNKVFLTGENGCGKTTMLKIIVGEESADTGEVFLGTNVKVGYYSQTLSNLNNDNTIFDEISNAYPRMVNTKIRNALAVFLFKGDEVFKKIENLSGGEKARVCLVKLMLSEVNFLVMDEPTNHLDIASKEALENALANYNGTMLMVSHDRYFINRLADKIFDMQDESIIEYTGNYEEFILQRANKNIAVKNDRPESEKINLYKQRKLETAERRKKENRFAFLEEEIALKEDKINILSEQLSSEAPDDYKKIMEITSQIEEIQADLPQLYEEWDLLAEEMDE